MGRVSTSQRAEESTSGSEPSAPKSSRLGFGVRLAFLVWVMGFGGLLLYELVVFVWRGIRGLL